MRWSGVVIALGFALSCSLPAVADSIDAPPPNLAKTTEHLATILANHERAVGRRAANLPDTAIEDWRYTDSGISGTEHLERSGMNFRSKITAGPLVDEMGQDGDSRWYRDYNGVTSPLTLIDDRPFFADRIYEDAADPKNDAKVIGITQGSSPAYVVQVQVSGTRHPEWVFYDATTFLITRVEWILHDDRGTHRIVTTYGDFRTTSGVTSAWHIHDAWDPHEYDDDYSRTSLQIGVPVDAAQFKQSPSRSQLPVVSSPVTLPAQIYEDGTIVIRLTIQGRGLDVILGTLDYTTLLDENVALQLGLPTYGHVDHLSDGSQTGFYTTVPTATIGSVTYKDLVVEAYPFTYYLAQYTKPVGILGYDFLASNVLEIQYDNGGKVTLLPPHDFDAADPIPGGTAYPITFDAGIPFVSLKIGGSVADHVIVDPDFSHSIVLGGFLRAHTTDFTSIENGSHYQAELPFANNGSFGHQVEAWPAGVSSLSFGSVNFTKVGLIATDATGFLSEDRPIDAFLGFDFLRWFDVYLDYPHSRIIVKPNQAFLKMIHHG